MRALFLLGMIVLSSGITTYAQTYNGNEIVGLWLTEDKDGKILIYKSGNEYKGKLIWGTKIYGPNGEKLKDLKNPDPSLRGRTLEGSIVLEGLVFDGDDTWEDGKIYHSAQGKTYDCNVHMEGKKLILRGFVGFSLLGKSTTWTRLR